MRTFSLREDRDSILRPQRLTAEEEAGESNFPWRNVWFLILILIFLFLGLVTMITRDPSLQAH